MRPPCHRVVLYLHSTSNHNGTANVLEVHRVVLYLHSTSNHNSAIFFSHSRCVVLYLHSTSNHNSIISFSCFIMLYYIFILHQTTTYRDDAGGLVALYYIFILHQTTTEDATTFVEK